MLGFPDPLVKVHFGAQMEPCLASPSCVVAQISIFIVTGIVRAHDVEHP